MTRHALDPSQLAAVMFDLDGTLIDTMGALADLAAQKIAQRYPMPATEARRRYLQTSGIPFRQQLDVIFPDDPRNDETSAVFERDKRAICDAAELPPETIAALAALRSRGLKLVVSSNSAQHYVDEFAERAAFRFDLALGFGAGLAKGEPHVGRVCELFGVRREQILFVGDSLKDGELAQRSRLPFVGRTGTFARERFAEAWPGAPVIDGLGDLVTLLGG
jgi:phosphoglycolate phosphatase